MTDPDQFISKIKHQSEGDAAFIVAIILAAALAVACLVLGA